MPLQDRRDEALVRRAYLNFAVLSAGLFGLVVVAVFVVAEVQSDRAAGSDARTRGDVMASAVAAGFEELDGRGPDEEFTQSLEPVAAHAGVRAVLVWDRAGTVVWSSRSSLIGQTFAMDPQVADVFESVGAPLVTNPGERLESVRLSGLLGDEVEVHNAIEDGSGTPLVVESFVDAATLVSSTSETVRFMLPLVGGALALLEGLALLAGAKLARRVQASRRERIRLLTNSLAAVDHERRRLAADLHDGIIQNLAGMRYALRGVIHEIGTDIPEAPRANLRLVSAALEQELTALRGTLGELLAVEHLELPLPQTLNSLLPRLVPPSITWSVEVDPSLDVVDARTAELVQRVTQEGVRNAVRHAHPRSVSVRVHAVDDGPGSRVRVEVEDDGKGVDRDLLDQTKDEPATANGVHVGVRLLRDLVHDLDGVLDLTSLPGGGSRLTAEWMKPDVDLLRLDEGTQT